MCMMKRVMFLLRPMQDAQSHKNKGIKEEKFQWKCIQDQSWTDGRIPRVIDADKVYLQKYAVCDEMGQWSDPCVEVVYAEKQENIDQFKDDMPPKVELDVSDINPYRGDTIVVSASATDDNGVAYVTVKANGRVISNYQGSVLYTCNSSGEVKFTAECDYRGNAVCYVNELLNAGDQAGSVKTLKSEHSKSDMPDYSYKLSKGVSYDVVYDGDQTISNASHDLSSSICAKGKLRISNTKFSGKGYIKADGDVVYDAVQNAEWATAAYSDMTSTIASLR